MIISLIIIGLITDIIGVFLLTLYSDHAFRTIFRHLGRTVGDDWDSIIKNALDKNQRATIAGSITLGIGFILQILGNIY